MAQPANAARPTNGKSARQQGGGGGESLPKRQLLAALRGLKRGEFDLRLPDDLGGIDGQICEAFNEVVSLIVLPGAPR